MNQREQPPQQADDDDFVYEVRPVDDGSPGCVTREEFFAHWGITPEEAEAEFQREMAEGGERTIYYSLEEFIAALTKHGSGG